MLRTQVYLPYSQVKALKQMASEKEVYMSEIIRKLVAEKFNGRLKTAKKETKSKSRHAFDGLLALARRFERAGVKGPRDLATNMDEYLYGGKI